MRVLIAPDKLKGCLTAAQAGEAIAAGVRRACPRADVRILPIADGGDGTVEALVATGSEPVAADVPPYAVTLARLAGAPPAVVVEVAQVGGLKGRRPTREDAQTATSWPAGALIATARRLVPETRSVVVGVGGTASTDGGAGALRALGARLLDAHGDPIGPGVRGLAELATVDLSTVDPALSLVVAADVDCPMTGPDGAAMLFGRQKGLHDADLPGADAALARFARLLAEATGRDVSRWPGAGAGGGLAGGLAGATGGDLRLGAHVVFDVVGIADALRAADIVITAEGSLDRQSQRGKAPIALARRARAAGVPCLAIAGAVTLDAPTLRQEGVMAAAALLDREPDLDRSIAHAPALLAASAADLLAQWPSLPE